MSFTYTLPLPKALPWLCAAPQTLSEPASLSSASAMALGFAVLLLVGTLGTGKGGVAWEALQGGGAGLGCPRGGWFEQGCFCSGAV